MFYHLQYPKLIRLPAKKNTLWVGLWTKKAITELVTVLNVPAFMSCVCVCVWTCSVPSRESKHVADQQCACSQAALDALSDHEFVCKSGHVFACMRECVTSVCFCLYEPHVTCDALWLPEHIYMCVCVRIVFMHVCVSRAICRFTSLTWDFTRTHQELCAPEKKRVY